MSYIHYNNSNIEIIGSGSYKPVTSSPKVDSKVTDVVAKCDNKGKCADVDTIVTDNCVNEPVPIAAIGSGAVARVPVVLAELTVQFNVNSVITLPEFAFEIKDIKKRLKITQCLLIQDTNVLFIKGFIRKTIDYTTRNCSNTEGFCGDVRHCTVDVPISCTTPVAFNGIAPLEPIPSTQREFQYAKKEDIFHPDFSEKDHLLSGDLRERNSITNEYFNQLPFCELVSSRIVEFDEQLMPVRPKGYVTPFEEKHFNRIEEKAVVFVTLRLLQNRSVAIPAVSGADDPCRDRD